MEHKFRIDATQADGRGEPRRTSAEPDFGQALITSRQNISAKRLVEPGPSPAQLAAVFEAAAAAPDHGMLCPWRFVLVPAHRRDDLATVFALALLDRAPGASLEQIEAAREKAYRAPCLLAAIARLGAVEPPIPVLERMVSFGAAVQNMLLSAHSMGLGGGLTSGQAMGSLRMRQLLRLGDGEEAVCFINLGTVSKGKMPRLRPDAAMFVTSL